MSYVVAVAGILLVVLMVVMLIISKSNKANKEGDESKSNKPKNNNPLISREKDIIVNDINDSEPEVEPDKDKISNVIIKEVQEIVDKVYLKSINYEKKLKSENIDHSMIVASEFTFAFLYAIDILLFNNFGPEFRNKLIDNIVPNVLRGYTSNFISDQNIAFELYEKLENTYNQRLLIYSKCELLPQSMPGKGTVAFALSYYMHQQKHKNPLKNEIDILTGVKDISSDDMSSIPNFVEVMQNQIELITSLKEYEINKNIDNLKEILT